MLFRSFNNNFKLEGKPWNLNQSQALFNTRLIYDTRKKSELDIINKADKMINFIKYTEDLVDKSIQILAEKLI